MGNAEESPGKAGGADGDRHDGDDPTATSARNAGSNDDDPMDVDNANGDATASAPPSEEGAAGGKGSDDVSAGEREGGNDEAEGDGDENDDKARDGDVDENATTAEKPPENGGGGTGTRIRLDVRRMQQQQPHTPEKEERNEEEDQESDDGADGSVPPVVSSPSGEEEKRQGSKQDGDSKVPKATADTTASDVQEMDVDGQDKNDEEQQDEETSHQNGTGSKNGDDDDENQEGAEDKEPANSNSPSASPTQEVASPTSPPKQDPLHEKTLKALSDHLKTYVPVDELDEDEVIEYAKKANDAARRRRQRRREMLIFGGESSSDDENDSDSDRGKDSDDEDDPEKAMWNHKEIDKNFFEFVVAAAAEASAATEDGILAGGASPSNQEAADTSSDEDNTDDDRSKSSRGSAARISQKQSKQTTKTLAPRAAMDERTLDVIRRNLGLRVTEYEYTSSGRRRKKRHYHHHHHHHRHHRHSDTDDSDGGRSSDGGGRAKPTRVTRRATKQHRQKKREERAARENRGIESLFTSAMDIDVEVEGEVFKTDTLLKAREQLKRKGQVESDTDDTDDESVRGRRRSRDDETSDDGSVESKKGRRKRARTDSWDEDDSLSKRRNNGEVPLFALVPTSADERPQHKSSISAEFDEEQERIDEESGVVYRPVTVTRLIVAGKPVYLAKLNKQILDAAKSRKKREKDEAAMRKRTARKAEDERRRKRRKRRVKSRRAYDEGYEDFFEYEKNSKIFDEDGPIFGEIIKDYDLYERTGKNFNQPVSLSLLDWRRRQQWAPTSKKGKSKAAQQAMDENDFDFGLTPSQKVKKSQAAAALASSQLDSSQQIWETINVNIDIPKQPSTLEQPRRRHSDLTYATWCTQLIHCLSGSGRSMARHEFFYSDIDRAWFNFNPFQADLAKLGVPPNAKLTRSEWSLVRRRIRNKPRRFSRRFIMSQIHELERYREFVRYIQRFPDADTSDFFGYEVPAPIRIGATVTAVNKKARILHRGIVLDRDDKRKGYLVQFERKELGYEFCPDIEVASHGVPEVMVPAADVSLDGWYMGSFAGPNSELGSLSYGTTYGPLVEFHRNQNRYSISRMRKLPASTVVRPNLLQVIEKSERDHRTRRGAPKEDAHEDMVEKVAERETLVKLMSLMHIMVERKAVLLRSIEICHQRWQAFIQEGGETSGETPNNVTLSSFKEHYAWLQANLALNNQSMEAALSHLRVMYGKAYAGQASAVAAEDEKQRVKHMECFIQEATHTPQCNNGLWNKWLATLAEKGDGIGRDLVSLSCSEANAKPSTKEEQVANTRDKAIVCGARSDFLESRLSSAAQLLQTAQLCGNGIVGKLGERDAWSINGNRQQLQHDERPSLDPGAVDKVLSDALVNLRPSSIDALPLDIETVDAVRETSYRDLSEAVAMFRAELAELSAETSVQ